MLQDYFLESQQLKETILRDGDFLAGVEECITRISQALLRGNKVLVAGNGGSAAQTQHFAAEFIGRYWKRERRAYPVMTLAGDTATLTALSNDYNSRAIFARQLDALGSAGDILLAFSTSGNSENLIEAAQKAHERDMTVIGWLGKGGGRLKDFCDLALVVPSMSTPRIQEIHGLMLHIISEECEKILVDGSTTGSTAVNSAQAMVAHAQLAPEALASYVENFRGKRIGVIGDVMLDRFMFGSASRLSPEAPVPVVLIDTEQVMPGGAGNVANNIVALGGEPALVGVVGDDRSAEILLREFTERHIETAGLFTVQDRFTTTKVRIVGDRQHIVRLDRETASPLSETIYNQMLHFVGEHIASWNVLIIADYMKGVVSENFMREVLSLANACGVPVFIDTKPEHLSYFKGATLLTPNKKEALAMAGVNDVTQAGRIIRQMVGAHVLITEGAKGMTLFEGEDVFHVPAMAKRCVDLSGAGDTVQAALALAVAGGASLKHAVVVANHAAGIAVGKTGTAVVMPYELAEDIRINGKHIPQ